MGTVTKGRYQIKHVYLVACTDCNQDIGRSLSGEDPISRAELDALLLDHDNAFHPVAGKPARRRGECIKCNREFTLNHDGSMRYHSTGSGAHCQGSGLQPRSVA
jgi:hypothetical protein